MSYNLREVTARKKREAWEKSVEEKLRENADKYIGDTSKTEEGLLDSERVGKDRHATIEKQLDDERSGTREAVTEKRMDTEKAPFGGVNRASVESGNIPPLEAKRLKTKPVMEGEKYRRANEK
jgi:hypothetical protein